MKLTETLIERFADAIKDGHSVNAACGICKVNRRTYSRWREIALRVISLAGDSDEVEPADEYQQLCLKFLEATEEAHATISHEALCVIKEKWKESWQAAAWFLERRYPQDYGRFGMPLSDAKQEDDTITLSTRGDATQAKNRLLAQKDKQREGV